MFSFILELRVTVIVIIIVCLWASGDAQGLQLCIQELLLAFLETLWVARDQTRGQPLGKANALPPCTIIPAPHIYIIYIYIYSYIYKTCRGFFFFFFFVLLNIVRFP